MSSSPTSSGSRLMRIVVLGPPGAGKGTQAVRLAEQFACADVATGDIFRANVAEGTELGRVAQEYMDRGDLVPDEVVIAMVMERLAAQDCQAGFVLDGFPRTVNQVEHMRRAGRLVGHTLSTLVEAVRPGVTLLELDALAEEVIRGGGGVPSFLDYHGFPNTLCLSPNDRVVHGIPDGRRLREGDILSID